MSTAIEEAVAVPPVAHPVDAETDVEVLHAVPQRFCICDERTANWLVKRIIAAREYGQRVRDWAEIERRRSEREEQTLMFLYSRQLQDWVRAELEKRGGRRKSLALPAGNLAFRRRNALLIVDDEISVLRWAKKNAPAVVEAIEKVSKSSLNDHFSQTGELPDGTHVEPAIEKFSIT